MIGSAIPRMCMAAGIAFAAGQAAAATGSITGLAAGTYADNFSGTVTLAAPYSQTSVESSSSMPRAA